MDQFSPWQQPDLPIEIVQGETFVMSIFYIDINKNPISLSGYTAMMQIRRTFEESDPPLVELSTENGEIVISAEAGSIQVAIPSLLTKDFPIEYEGIYDLFLYSANGDMKVVGGPVYVDGRVTK
jgi:hypothetical protein